MYLKIEILCALEIGILVRGTRRLDTPFCQDLLREEMPLIQYSKPTKFQDGLDLMELSCKLWQGGRIMIKSLNTNQRVRFGLWSDWRPPNGIPELEL